MYEMRVSYSIHKRKRARLLVLLCLWARDKRGGGVMAKCGVCGGGIAHTLVPHGAICEDDRVGERMTYSPEIDDLIKMEEEGNEE
jgi:hypothetical protein